MYDRDECRRAAPREGRRAKPRRAQRSYSTASSAGDVSTPVPVQFVPPAPPEQVISLPPGIASPGGKFAHPGPRAIIPNSDALKVPPAVLKHTAVRAYTFSSGTVNTGSGGPSVATLKLLRVPETPPSSTSWALAILHEKARRSERDSVLNIMRLL
jgi:hypothetical protein